MAELEKEIVTPTPEDPEYVKPNPQDNPRNISLKEIADKVAKQHVVDEKEDSNVATIDDEGNVTPAPGEKAAPEPTEPVEKFEVSAEPAPAEPAPAPEPEATPTPTAPLKLGEEAIDPTKEYEMVVDGQKINVLGKKIIDAGYRTFQKETAADFRLNVATELMNEAERRMAAAKGEEKPAPAAATPTEPSNEDLAKAIQFGTPEDSAKAIAALRVRGFDDQKVAQFTANAARTAARDELQFQKALDFVKTEYSDLLASDHLKRFFFMEENRYRAPKDKGGLGDTRPYLDVYKDIGEKMRESFKVVKPTPNASPTSTAAGRREIKASTPPVPRTAASRLAESPANKPRTTPEIIAGMAAARGKNRLTPATKE